MKDHKNLKILKLMLTKNLKLIEDINRKNGNQNRLLVVPLSTTRESHGWI